MTATETLLREPAAQAIGWALVQFVWQGALIGLFTAVALAALRRSAADIRYVVAAIGLTLMLTMPVVTAVQTWGASTMASNGPAQVSGRVELSAPSAVEAQAAQPGASTRAFAHGPGTVSSGAELTNAASFAPFSTWMPVLFVVWLVGVALLTLRLLTGWLWVQRLKSHATVPAASVVGDMAARLARRLHITRTVTFLESALVDVPTVIGWLRPVVLVPASALAGLSPSQLEAILAHELAHIRRHDYLVNLLQTLVETLLFYHPAVWWLSRRIRIEREHCCDDLAVSLCGDPVSYARALADLEELRGRGNQFVLAANGGSLLDRVRRLLGAPTHAGRGPGWLAASVSVLVISAIAGGALGTDIVGSDQPAGPPSPAAIAPTPSLPSAVSPASRPVLPTVEATEPVQATTPAKPVLASTQAAAAAADDAGRQARELARQVAEATVAIAQHALMVDDAALKAALDQHAMSLDQAAVSLQVAAKAGEAALTDATAALAHAASLLEPIAAPAQTKSKGNFTWSNNGEKLSVSYDGAIEFTDDDTDIKSLSPGGTLKIKEGGLLASRSVEFRADASGKIERRFWVGMSERPFEPDGRQWLATALPRFIRQTGIGAPARVARIMRQKGPDGVLAEIALIDGSWAKRIYFTELLKTDRLDPQIVERALKQAAGELDSDFEKASLLIGSADRLLVNDATRKAYFDAARTIDSDFEMRRVYSSAMKRGTMSPELMFSLLDASTSIESDFEAASLLMEAGKLQALDARTRPAYFKVLNTIESDFERRRVLTSILANADGSSEARKAVLDAAATMDSDFEKASVLVSFLERTPALDENLRAAFFRVVDTMDSSFERSRVLKTVLEPGNASPQTVVAALRSTSTMDGTFEASQILQTIASKYTLTGEARDLYINAAERLGDFEQSRALAALVKSERRK
jgi:beta-lactamase regulating signal transducer with metallopeptidase domain